MCFRIVSVSRVIEKLREGICVVYSCLCFVRVNQLHLFAVNIKEYHWLVHQPIRLLYGLSHYQCHDLLSVDTATVVTNIQVQ